MSNNNSKSSVRMVNNKQSISRLKANNSLSLSSVHY